MSERTDDTLLRRYKGSIESHHIYDAAMQGDAMALDIFEYTGKILGMTLADAVAITSPQAIIFFGGLAKSGDFLMKPLRKHFEDNLLVIYKNRISLLYSDLQDADAAILGASALAW